jgi:hypothetical protein
MKTEVLLKKIEDSYRSIDFAIRYKKLMNEHNDFQNRLQKVEKKEVLAVLKNLGYNFKVFSPGQDFYIENVTGEYKFIFSFKCKSAIMENYIFVYYNNAKIIYEENLAFIFRALMGDMNTSTTAPKFRDYEEFQKIITLILQIYEDFKTEFLKQVAQTEEA